MTQKDSHKLLTGRSITANYLIDEEGKYFSIQCRMKLHAQSIGKIHTQHPDFALAID